MSARPMHTSGAPQGKKYRLQMAAGSQKVQGLSPRPCAGLHRDGCRLMEQDHAKSRAELFMQQLELFRTPTTRGLTHYVDVGRPTSGGDVFQARLLGAALHCACTHAGYSSCGALYTALNAVSEALARSNAGSETWRIISSRFASARTLVWTPGPARAQRGVSCCDLGQPVGACSRHTSCLRSRARQAPRPLCADCA